MAKKKKSKRKPKQSVSSGTYTYKIEFVDEKPSNVTTPDIQSTPWTFHTTPSRPKIYLAGPDVFVPKPIEHGERLKKICAKYGLEGMFPMDNQLPVFKEDQMHDAGMWIYRCDIAMMDRADACIANMTPFRGPSMDSGTCFEMGYITAQKKPLFGYTIDGRSYDTKAAEWNGGRLVEEYETGQKRDNNGDSVEGFGMHDNLMMVGGVVDSTGFIYSSFEYAVKAAAEYFKKIGKL